MKKDNQNNVNKEAKLGYSFYSRLLGKPFDTVEELAAAELEYYDKLRAKDEKAAAKKADAQKVEDAFKALNAARRDYKEKLNQLTEEFSAALTDLKKAYELGKSDLHNQLATAEQNYKDAIKAFGEKYPDRYFDVGIAESHALTFSAGLAAGGYKPFVAIYSTFLQRGYDNLLHDIALQNLPVKLMIDRAGLSVGDGATHHGIFDVAFISHIPNMTLLAPASYASLSDMIAYASNHNGPIAIRYPNGAEYEDLLAHFKNISSNPLCRFIADFEEKDCPEYVFITYGGLLERVCLAADILRAEGMRVGVIVVETIKPYNLVAKEIMPLVLSAKRIVYAEEGIKNGGAAEITRAELISLGLDTSKIDYRIASIDDNFASPTTLCDLYDFVGLSAQKLADKMRL